jgi:hypothetical protein
MGGNSPDGIWIFLEPYLIPYCREAECCLVWLMIPLRAHIFRHGMLFVSISWISITLRLSIAKASGGFPPNNTAFDTQEPY